MTRSLFAILISGLLLIGWPLTSFAHAHLEKSVPEKDSELTDAPQAVQLWFSEDVQGEWSKIIVMDAEGNRVDKEAISGNDENHKFMQVDLNDLHPGTYNVNWSTLSRDGHRVKGEFSFKVK